MVIVSQDKNTIVNFSNVQYIERKDNYIYLRGIEDDFTIGDYTTEERAKEVLEKIVMAYNNFELLKATVEMQRVQISSIADQYGKFDVYEMPEE